MHWVRFAGATRCPNVIAEDGVPLTCVLTISNSPPCCGRHCAFPRRICARVLRISFAAPITRGGGAPDGARMQRHPAGVP
jgi:hypothetical protein